MSAASHQQDVTRLLHEVQGRRPGAVDELLPLVYAELRRIAANYMSRERAGHTLQATALVHEAYMQLVDQTRVTWQGRAHFIGVAAQLMRRVLLEHARAAHAAKRGGGEQKLSLNEEIDVSGEREIELVNLDDALTTLASLDARQSKIVELRFFGGLTTEETAEVMGISTATIEREWRSARAWLKTQLQRG